MTALAGYNPFGRRRVHPREVLDALCSSFGFSGHDNAGTYLCIESIVITPTPVTRRPITVDVFHSSREVLSPNDVWMITTRFL